MITRSHVQQAISRAESEMDCDDGVRVFVSTFDLECLVAAAKKAKYNCVHKAGYTDPKYECSHDYLEGE